MYRRPAERVGAGERSRRGNLTLADATGMTVIFILALRKVALAAGLGVE